MEVLLIIVVGIAIFVFKWWLFDIKRKKDETIIETSILNLTNGNENDTLFSNEIIGVVYIVVRELLRFIIKDTQKET